MYTTRSFYLNKLNLQKDNFMIKQALILIILGLWLNSCGDETNKAVFTNANDEANDLINETSPYLLQHAYNPVNWKAWNKETLKLAKQQNKLMIISVGYSACHWCHVMEEESFENDSVAKLMNDNFINIKIDREERPDVDQIYMNAVQLMTGSGGWPLNCIALPDGRPVFGGTYFTKKQWTKILEDMSNLYKSNPDKVISYAEQLTEGIKNSNLITVNKNHVPFHFDSISRSISVLEKSLDYKFGGSLGDPKFPMPSQLNLLLRYSHHNDNKTLQGYVLKSLNKMANGGIYDHIGGGFSRYSVDEKWHIPHFEKMLYDNAQLVSLYSKAFQVSQDENYKTIVEETLKFVEDELTAENGSFYSAIDADSKNDKGEMEEGAFYVWSREELKAALKNDFELFQSYYNVNAVGKWENDTYVLYKTKSDEEFSREKNIPLEDLNFKVKKWKRILKDYRNQRELPRKDDKALTSWNAMMLSAYIDAHKAFGNQDYLNKAIKNAHFIIENQLREDGGLNHNYKDDKSSINGFLEDYAHVISAYIKLYQVTLDEKWLTISKSLLDYTVEHFVNEGNGMFYYTSNSETNLIARKTEVFDNVIPSSNSIMAVVLFKLGHYYSEKKYIQMSNQMLNNLSGDMLKTPSGYTNWLTLYLNRSNPYYEVAIIGDEAQGMLKKLNAYYLPNILISSSIKESKLPLLKNKYIEDQTLIYVCVNGTCKLPVSVLDEALSQISK
ncbi:MAG: thioredoxin domain-containing protein [Winogradskyella sp.]